MLAGALLGGRGIHPLALKTEVSLSRPFAPKMLYKGLELPEMPSFRIHIPCLALTLDATLVEESSKVVGKLLSEPSKLPFVV